MQESSPAPNPFAHWQAGGWFGSQLGGTAWLFVGAGVVASDSPRSAAVLLACGLAANLVGCSLWAARARLNPYRALQVLVVAIAVVGVVATRWLESCGEFALLDPRVSPRTMYVLLGVLFAVLISTFEGKHRASRKSIAAG